MAGRKTKCTPELIQRVAEGIRLGNYANVVAAACSIGDSTYYQWLAQGNKDIENGKESIYAEFAEAIKKASSEAEMRNIALIDKAAEEQWQAAAWKLERRHNDRWGKNVTVKGDDEKPIKVEVTIADM